MSDSTYGAAVGEKKAMPRLEEAGIPVLYTVPEAAAILRVKESWLERQAAARKIPFTMPGGAYHFTAGHLAEIVRIYEHVPAAAAGEPAPAATSRRKPRTRNDVPADGMARLRPRTPRQRRAA